MSDLDQLHTALNRLFHQESQRIVFWNDPDGEFLDTLPSIAVPGVTMLRLDQTAALATKIRLEREDIEGKYLLYSPTEEPSFEDDWLLDIRLYSAPFRADRASILLQELSLTSLSLRSHIADRRKFFDAKARREKLKSFVEPSDNEIALDLKMLAVVTKADSADLFNVLHTVFHAWNDAGDEIELDTPPAVWGDIVKFDLEASFWKMAKAKFGYDDESPSLKMFLVRLMLTDYAHHLKGGVPQTVRNLLLPEVFRSNVVVCLAQWRDSASKSASYDRLSAEAAGVLKLEGELAQLDIEQIADVFTFLAVEKRIASALRDRVQSTADIVNAEKIRAIATRRQSGHWAGATGVSSKLAPREALHAVYDAVVAAADFHALRNQYKDGFDYPDATAMYRAYETKLFRFDQFYRLFCESADVAEAQGWNIVKPMRAEVEAHYVNWYLLNLSMAWGKFLDPKDGLLSKWRIEDVSNQYRFFESKVRPWLDGADNRRAFVIVSDALRYEAAEELTAELNGKYRFEATLSSQLGVLPSYTALGMASLLPHKTLAYKGTDVLVDGKSSVAGARDAILQSVNGLACKSSDLMAMTKEKGREFVKDKRVVYIYHNTIDAIGDQAGTEDNTFAAVRQAIGELAALVGNVVNNLNAHQVIITADHGFLFSETSPSDPEKSKLTGNLGDAIVAKKRYVIGANLPSQDGAALHGRLSATAKVDGDMEFLIPKGANRFHLVGGAKFVHGGAMPQEIVVPVITVKQIRGKSAQDTKSKLVSVHVLGSAHRITAAYHRFTLMQMEQVSDRVKPVTLRVGVYDGDQPVTDIQKLRFDSESSSLDDRKKEVRLALKDGTYDKKKPFRLVLTDADTGIEQQRVEVIIDRTFTDDF